MALLLFRPIDAWPDGWRDPNRVRPFPPFSGDYQSTLRLLDVELRALDVDEATLQVDASPRDVRADGQLRADARVNHPGVIVTLDTPAHGTLVYPCDAFDGRRNGVASWKHNLRAIALGLQSLRRVERYGIANRGQQYAGWKALGSGVPLGPAMTVDEALRLLVVREPWEQLRHDPGRLRRVVNAEWRVAAREHHPDLGGDPEVFRRLTEARDLLLAQAVS